MWKVILTAGVLFCSGMGYAGGKAGISLSQIREDSVVTGPEKWSAGTEREKGQRFIHRLGIELRPGYIVPTNMFLRGENQSGQRIRSSLSTHLQYSFQVAPYTCMDRIYGGVYQGIGLAYYQLSDRKEIGDPIVFYLFQGARIARFNRWVSFNYEWNFGLSTGWKPYDYMVNSYNKMVGSKINAYINTDFYLNWHLFSSFDVMTGIALSHFSNGNTRYPNAGLNTIGFKLGIVYNFNRKDAEIYEPYRPEIPPFPRHMSYDVVFFGSWRRKGITYLDKQVASPEAYTVLGGSFAAMYNMGYKFRTGLAIDGVYDGSANVYAIDAGSPEQKFYKPPLDWQLALGISARAEYVMPYFTVGIGVGTNVLYRGRDQNGCYQMLALKIHMTRCSFLHVGYNLKDFKDPNFLMLGIGFRFNNKYPVLNR